MHYYGSAMPLKQGPVTMSKKIRCTIIMIVTAASLCAYFGADTAATWLKLKPSGFASLQFGDIVKGGVNLKTGEPMDNTWMKNLIAGLSVDAALTSVWKCRCIMIFR